MVPVVFLFLLGLSSFGATTLFAADQNKVKPGEFVIEPPTLINLGFEWFIEGDDNRDATVEVWYRKKGSTTGKRHCRFFASRVKEFIQEMNRCCVSKHVCWKHIRFGT